VKKRCKGPSIKDVRSQGEGGFSADKWGSSEADVRTFLCKTIGFFEIYGMPRRTRGLRQCGHFADKGEGVNFSRFCVDDL